MCIAIPAKIMSIEKNLATVESLGVSKEVDITLVPEARTGDYVIVHAGFAIQLIDKEEALITREYLKDYFDEG